MKFYMGARRNGKTTFLRAEVIKAAMAGLEVQVIVANKERQRSWVDWLTSLPEEEFLRNIQIVPSRLIDQTHGSYAKHPYLKKFIDDADEVLAELTNGFDIAISNGEQFGPGELDGPYAKS
jgi:hypothetical protein